MGWITSTMSLPGTNCKSHGQNSGAPAKFQTESQDSVPIYLHLAVSKENYNRMTHLSHRKLDWQAWSDLAKEFGGFQWRASECLCHGTHINESWHTYEWVMAHLSMSHSTHMNESWRTYEWVMAHLWMSHGTHMKESWHTYEWVMAYIWMSHVTHIHGKWHTHTRVLALLWIRHGTPMNTSWHTYEYVMAHIWIRHGTPMNTSWLTYEYVMAHLWIRHGTHMNTSWHTYELRPATYIDVSLHTCTHHLMDLCMCVRNRQMHP